MKSFDMPEKYSEISNALNKNIQDFTMNSTNVINELISGGIENFNRLQELSQRYYNEVVQNHYNYVRRIERSYNRQ